VILGDIREECSKLATNSSSYIVIASHGHAHDQVALQSMIEKEYKYIGVIGSRNKISKMFENLKNKGVDEELLKKVHSPIGLALGGNSPEDIALSIMAEIIMVKNEGQCITMREKIMK
jgi:xanthine dehydrogenase accessory factor